MSAVLKLNARVSVPTTVIFGDVNGMTVVPVMIGVGGEYRLQPMLALVVDLAPGGRGLQALEAHLFRTTPPVR